MRIKLSCLSCGHLFELGDAYESYTGQIRCWGCQTTLDIALFEGKLQSMRLHDENAVVLVLPAPPAPDIEVLILPQATLPDTILREEVLAETRRPRRKAR